jgi:DNA adenine methylase
MNDLEWEALKAKYVKPQPEKPAMPLKRSEWSKKVTAKRVAAAVKRYMSGLDNPGSQPSALAPQATQMPGPAKPLNLLARRNSWPWVRAFATLPRGIRQNGAVAMPLATSPLRYPGGKTCMLGAVSRILRGNKLERGHYAEPYAGGCGLALALLYSGFVSDIHVNDIDRSIWAFWHVVLNHTEEFIGLMEKTPVTLKEWRRQREILHEDSADPMKLGFAMFFVNRTSRSGITKRAGVIGGLKQKSNYTIDCRFNKEELARRIRRVRKYRGRINLYRKDAIKFIDYAENNLPTKTFLYIDPPYYHTGSRLYTSFYNRKDHEKVADRILALKLPWILTYDYCEEIHDLYTARRQFQFSLNYSAQVKRLGTELLIASKGLRIPDDSRASQVHRPRDRTAA